MRCAELDEEIVDLLYEGIVDAAAMERAIRTCITRLEASGGNIQITSKTDFRTLYFAGFGDGYTGEKIAIYLSHWQYANAHRDAMRRAYKTDPGKAFLCHDHISDADFETGAYFQEFFGAMSLRWLAGGLARSSNGVEVSVAFSRRADQPRFGAPEAAFISDLLPHIRRASGLALRLGLPVDAPRAPMENGLMWADTAAFLIDIDGHVHWQNEAGSALSKDDCGIGIEGGRFVLDDPVASKELTQNTQAALDQRLATVPSRPIMAHTNGKSLELKAVPATMPNKSKIGAVSLVLLMARRTGLSPVVAERLRDRYQLTPAEGALALLMAEGIGISEAAVRKNVSPHTVRTQLRSIFSKTNVTTQTALTALVWRSV